MATPTDNGPTLDKFNDALRASPGWQNFMRRQGIPLDGRPIQLSGSQRAALQRDLERAGVQFPKGMQIDPAGNVNQDQGVSRHWNNPWIRWPVIAGAALATMGAAGYGPLAGAFGGGGAGAGGAAGAAGGAGGAASGAGGLGLASGGALPLGTGLTTAQMATPAFGSLAGATAPIAGLAAGTLPSGAAAPIATPGMAGIPATLPGIPAGTLPGGGAAPNVTPGLPPGSAGTPGLGQVTAQQAARNAPGSILSRLRDPEQLASIIPALVAAARGGGGGSEGIGANQPQLDALIKMASDRAQRTDPLHQMVTRLAESRMPINSRNP